MQTSYLYHQCHVSYRILGEGKPVLLIHGFGEDSHIWDRQIDFLKDHCKLIIPDLPGSGDSGFLSESALGKNMEDPIRIDDYADLICSLMDHASIESCTMLGHSMGGYITLAFAEKYPHRLMGFGLVHSTAMADSPEKKSARQKGIALMEQYGAASFLRTTIPNLFTAAFRKNFPESVASLIEKCTRFDTAACQQYYRAMMLRPDRTAVLKNAAVPVLFIIGTEDMAVPMNDLLPQILLPADPQVHILEAVGHMGMWEATDALNQHLLGFIQGKQ